MNAAKRIAPLVVSLFVCGGADAATYIVPPDEVLVQRADGIFIGRALHSYVEDTKEHGLVTATVLAIEETLKSAGPLQTITIRTIGGRIEENGRWRAKIVPGAPRFVDGERVLVFASKNPAGTFAVTDFGLGLFGFATDDLGNSLLIRADSEINGWSVDGAEHRELRRSAARFKDFIREVANGLPARPDYTIEARPLVGESPSIETTAGRLKQGTAACSGCTIKQYTLTFGTETNDGYRWRSFPVNWNRGNNFTSAPNNGSDAINTGFSWWEGATNAIDYTLASTIADEDGILENADGRSNIVFEKSLAGAGIGQMTCNPGGFSGTFGLGGIQAQGPTPVMVGSESFAETTEADVSMNFGVNPCVPSPISIMYFTAALAHEIGHTLGLRHTELSRNNSRACTAEVNYDCEGNGTSIMNSFVPNLAGLAAWDVRAISALYPPAAFAAPANLVATATTATSVSLSWSAVGGAPSYEVHRSASNNAAAFTVVCSGAATACSDNSAAANSAYLYKVRVSTTGPFSTPDLATTVIFAEGITQNVTTIKRQHIIDIRTAVNAVQTLAGQTPTAYTDNTINQNVTTVKTSHINEPRSRLNTARLALGIGAMAFTEDPVTTSTTIKALHITQLRAGVQ